MTFVPNGQQWLKCRAWKVSFFDLKLSSSAAKNVKKLLPRIAKAGLRRGDRRAEKDGYLRDLRSGGARFQELYCPTRHSPQKPLGDDQDSDPQMVAVDEGQVALC